MRSDVEGHAAPSRHLLEPTELPNDGDHTPGEETDVGEGGAGRDAGLGTHQSLREQVVVCRPTVEGVPGHRTVPNARQKRVNGRRLPRRSVTGQHWNLVPTDVNDDRGRVWSVDHPQFIVGYLTAIEDGARAALLGNCVDELRRA
jgi:hypothetical protein